MSKVAVVIPTSGGGRPIGMVIDAILRSIGSAPYHAQVTVVVNGCRDDTLHSLERRYSRTRDVRIIEHPVPGAAAAKNYAMKQLEVDAVLFTDDDVIVPPEWINRMARPLVAGEVHAVTSAVRLGPSISTHPMSLFHRELLADTGAGLGNPPRTLIGASMGVRRTVFEAGFRFEERLGPGALGYMEESLLHMQIIAAGGVARCLDDVIAIHHVDLSRFTRSAWLSRAAMQGRCEAWITHHWEHRRPRIEDAYVWARAGVRLACDSIAGHEQSFPSERELQRTRGVAAGRWWVSHWKDVRAYPGPRWVPARLSRVESARA